MALFIPVRDVTNNIRGNETVMSLVTVLPCGLGVKNFLKFVTKTSTNICANLRFSRSVIGPCLEYSRCRVDFISTTVILPSHSQHCVAVNCLRFYRRRMQIIFFATQFSDFAVRESYDHDVNAEISFLKAFKAVSNGIALRVILAQLPLLCTGL